MNVISPTTLKDKKNSIWAIKLFQKTSKTKLFCGTLSIVFVFCLISHEHSLSSEGTDYVTQ